MLRAKIFGKVMYIFRLLVSFLSTYLDFQKEKKNKINLGKHEEKFLKSQVTKTTITECVEENIFV